MHVGKDGFDLNVLCTINNRMYYVLSCMLIHLLICMGYII